MKKIEGDKVFVNKGMVMEIREMMGFDIQSSIIPTDIWIKMMGFADGQDDVEFFFWDSNSDFVFTEVFDEDAKEFIRNADFILDYNEYFFKPLGELMNTHDDLVREYNEKADYYRNKMNECINETGAEKIYNNAKPIMDALDLKIRELYKLVKYKDKLERETAEKEAEERRKDAERIASEEQQIEEIFYGPEEEKTTIVTKVLGKFLGRGKKTKK